MTVDRQVSAFIVDDHALFREGLADLLAAQDDIAIAGQAGDAQTAIQEVAASRPDILLMDIDLPGLSSFSAVEAILEHNPEIRVIFLSAFAGEVFLRQAIRLKAWGYVVKGIPFVTLLHAIREVANGWVYYSPQIKKYISTTPEGPRFTTPLRPPMSLLTPRELEVLRYLATGMSLKEAARFMHISVKTTDNHRASLMSKTGLHDRVKLARYALREGLVTC